MPPTIPSSSSGHSTLLVSQALFDCGPDLVSIHCQRTRKLTPALFLRNFDTTDQGDGQSTVPDVAAISDTTIDTYVPYSPPPSLHPSIVAPSATSEAGIPPGSGTLSPSHPRINTAAVVIAFSVAFISILCGLTVIMFVRWLRKRKIFKYLGRFWYFLTGKSGKTTQEEDPVVFIGIDYTGGLALVHDTTLDFDLERKSTSGSVRAGQSTSGPPRIPPSVISAESLTIQPDGSIPTMTGFQQRLDVEEADITLAIGIAMRDCTYSGSDLSTITQSPKLSAVDGYRDSLELKNRTRKDSDASHSSGPTTNSDVFSITLTTRSSLTSIIEIANDSEFEEFVMDEVMEAEMDAEDVVFEVARAHAQSMEIKRGVLIDWTAQRASLSPIMEEMEAPASIGFSSFPSTSCMTVPSLVVTCPSMMTIPHIKPSFSSVSVDLNEFPLPPSAFNYDKVDDFDLCTPVMPGLYDSRMGKCTLH